MFHPLKMLIVSGRNHKAHLETTFYLLAQMFAKAYCKKMKYHKLVRLGF